MKGMTFLGTLTLIFIVLKLCKVINWSWIWVLAPTWMAWGVLLILLIPVGIWWIAIGKKGRQLYRAEQKAKKFMRSLGR